MAEIQGIGHYSFDIKFIKFIMFDFCVNALCCVYNSKGDKQNNTSHQCVQVCVNALCCVYNR